MEQRAVLDHRDRRGRDVPRQEVRRHHPVDERLELRRVGETGGPWHRSGLAGRRLLAPGGGNAGDQQQQDGCGHEKNACAGCPHRFLHALVDDLRKLPA
jgi:hypothetical protein